MCSRPCLPSSFERVTFFTFLGLAPSSAPSPSASGPGGACAAAPACRAASSASRSSPSWAWPLHPRRRHLRQVLVGHVQPPLLAEQLRARHVLHLLGLGR